MPEYLEKDEELACSIPLNQSDLAFLIDITSLYLISNPSERAQAPGRLLLTLAYSAHMLKEASSVECTKQRTSSFRERGTRSGAIPL